MNELHHFTKIEISELEKEQEEMIRQNKDTKNKIDAIEARLAADQSKLTQINWLLNRSISVKPSFSSRQHQETNNGCCRTESPNSRLNRYEEFESSSGDLVETELEEYIGSADVKLPVQNAHPFSDSENYTYSRSIDFNGNGTETVKNSKRRSRSVDVKNEIDKRSETDRSKTRTKVLYFSSFLINSEICKIFEKIVRNLFYFL